MLDYLLIPAVAYLFSGIAMNALVPDGLAVGVDGARGASSTTLLNLWGVRAAAPGRVRGAGDGDRGPAGLRGVGGRRAGARRGAARLAVAADRGRHEGRSRCRRCWARCRSPCCRTWASTRSPPSRRRSTGGSAKVARAVLFCLALAGVLFVAQTYLAALLEPMTSAELAADPGKQGSAFYDAVDVSVGDLAARPGGGQQGDRRGVRGAGGAGGGRAAAVRDGPGPAAAAGAVEGPDSGVPRVALLCAAVDHAGGGGVGGPPRRRARPSGVGGRTSAR